MRFFVYLNRFISEAPKTKGGFLLDKETFIKKLLMYKDTVFRVAYSYVKNKSDAEDISQEVFLKLYTSAPDFNSEQAEKAWLIRITINKSKDLVKSGWFSRRSDNTEFTEHYEMSTAESDMLEKVLSLPDKYRSLIHLYYYEEYSVKEISEITGVKASTVQTRLQRGRKLLEKKLKEEMCYEKRNILPSYEKH
ncbi:MAG: sigma-70 family RNA polymerase sigma factor [Ruminococcus sp.]|nr:sigma-70 family RNA polymerase sigma factor [Ruminococcus sp.]